ncbi:MAG: hypothetical protein EBU90_24775 [Proteobacteria bacterium]|nr:hypothetical protein [Pseudomonadota bacterium]
MLIDIIVGVLCAWLSMKIISIRSKDSPVFKIQEYKHLNIEIQKPLDNVYLVYLDDDFVFQATSVEDCADKILDKFGKNNMKFKNKDNEVPEKEFNLLMDTLLSKINNK